MRVELNDVTTEDDLRVTYQGEPFTGEVVERVRGGQIVAVRTYHLGVEDGPSAAWYPTGERKGTGVVRMGTAIGVHEVWHQNGTPAVRVEFDDDGNFLSRRRWTEDGTLVEEEVADS